jgi:hypothetical protein
MLFLLLQLEESERILLHWHDFRVLGSFLQHVGEFLVPAFYC